MSDSTRAKLRRTKRSHLTKHQRGMVASQHSRDKYAQYNAEIRGRGDKKVEELMKEIR